ncbi:hypothetical protein HOD20_08270 [archaeon]|jgi:hypothetical protein|nr:hypothetical protein [archaeon]MBT4352505.1 hypothetical protein [archaeon]MBT4648620.1 hypothetical protein [archaeon]MBT6821450.1 hypothetical protein [archaeon]MBT7393044.1 hypothetical protein [archaeon]
MVEENTGANKDEQIGFHKGALSTLAKERQELSKILGIVEQLMQMHVKALQELGVDLVKMAEDQKGTAGKTESKPIEDLVNK